MAPARAAGNVRAMPAAFAEATTAEAPAPTAAPQPAAIPASVTPIAPAAVAASPSATSPRRAAIEAPGVADVTSAGSLAPPPMLRAVEAGAPAAPPPATTPARQIAPVIVSVAIAGGTARLAVSLEPAELGRVEISVERKGDTADIRVTAERPETLALLQRDQRELDRALTQAGIGTDGRSLSFSLSDGGGFASGRDAEGRGQPGQGPQGANAPGTAPAAEAPPPRRLLSLIDLAV